MTHLIFLSALLLLISIVLSKTSHKFGTPSLLLFLITGMLAGSEGIGGIEFDDYQFAQFVGNIALIFIIYSGGLETKFSTIRPVLTEGIILSTLGVLLSVFAVGGFVYLVTDFSLLVSLLIGAIVSSTDAAAVFGVFRSRKMGLKHNLRPLLELESGSNDPMAYIRPSASGATLGGVNNKTRETMLLCEAAGYEVILIETVGVGQSETTVAEIADFFLLLMLAGAGDELQGIKKGIMEMADALVITKADGDNVTMSQMAAREYANAMRLFPAQDSGWEPEVLTCSSVEQRGLDAVWDVIVRHHELMCQTGYFQAKRMEQNIAWMNEIIDYYLKYDFLHAPAVSEVLDFTQHQVESGKLPAITAAKRLLERFRGEGTEGTDEK